MKRPVSRKATAPSQRRRERMPTVRAVRVTKFSDNDLLLVRRCPFCTRRHTHGACGKGSPFGAGNGPRLAHCGQGTYRVREVLN